MEVPGWSLTGYEIEQLLGYGATGEVWRAHETMTGDVVALKRLRTRTDPAARDQVRRAVARLAAFRHPHVVALRSVVGASDGVVLILDHVAGRTLGTVLQGRGRLTAGEVVSVAVPLADALGAAHRRGLVHGDLCPASVLLDLDGRPLLTDLGLALLVDRPPLPLDGSAAYADPAAAPGARPTPAGDVFALGAICWELLTGAPPGVVAPGPGAPRAEQLSRQVSGLPPQLVALVAAALAGDPVDRPDAEAFSRGLRAAAPSVPTVGLMTAQDQSPSTASSPPVSVAEPEPAVPVATDPFPQRPAAAFGAGVAPALPMGQRHRPARVVRLMAVAAAVAAGAVALGWAVGRQGQPEVGVQLAVAAPRAAGAEEGTPAGSGSAGQPDWVAIVDGLDRRRDEALGRADAAALTEADERGSPAATADAAAVQQLVAAHACADRLVHEVRSATVVSAEPGSVLLRVVDAMPAYALVDADGGVLARRPARSESGWQVQLARAPEGWRIRAVQPEPSELPPAP